MLHLARGLRRSLVAFCAILGLLAAGLPGSAHALRQNAAPQAAGVSATPSALAFTVQLGQRDAGTVSITNTSGQAYTPAIYEAYPAVPATQAKPAVPAGLQRVALPRQPAQIDPQLAADVLAARSGQADFLIYLRDQADLSAAYQIADWRARGAFVYETLRSSAEQSQGGLRAALDARQIRYRPLWIVNAVVAHGTLADAIALAGRAEVALVRANHVTRLAASQAATAGAVDSRCSPDSPINPICWNIRQIGADRVWRDFGDTGRGITLASMDTGVRYTHPALAKQYRGYRGPGSYDHNYNWFDPKGIDRAPVDSNGHGTHTAGTMVASGGTASQPAVGVAPGAEWIAAQGCSGAVCNESDLIAAAQWMLAPTDLDGTRPRPDLRPMIINNSWAGVGGDEWYAGYVTAWRAAGIFPVFAAGNSGDACGSIESPGDYANVLAVGATDERDVIASFSARGPTRDGRRKPDVVAPGAYSGNGFGILSTGPDLDTPYFALQGTSMATPHVSGLIALLWSANPALIGDYATTYALLRETSRDLNDTRCGDPLGAPNNIYGNGRVDAYTLIQRARVDVPWLSVTPAAAPIAPNGTAAIGIQVDANKTPGPGQYAARVLVYPPDLTQMPTTIQITLTIVPGTQPVQVSGRVVSAETGAPLAAQVGIRGGLATATTSTGQYTLTLAPGTYDIVASAHSFLPAKQTVAISADLQLADIALQPDSPRFAVAHSAVPATIALGQTRVVSITLANSGTQPLYYTLRAPPDQFAMARSDEAGGPAYNWIDLPSSAHTLRLSDDGYAESVPLGMEFPFYSYSFTDTLVTANGLLAFSLPNNPYEGLSTSCFPDTSFFFYEIAPFRADLDPSKGGQIRFGTLDRGRVFVLSYEQIPLHGGAPATTYSFQVLLYNDGRIVYQYKQIPALPNVLAVGLQRSVLEYQKIGCGKTAPIRDGLAIELRPQANVAQWLRLSETDGTLPPGGTRTITAKLNWAFSRAPIQRGQIEITSTDPLRPLFEVPLSVAMLPAPQQRWFPFMPRSF
jgi:subtilisin family serine protease